MKRTDRISNPFPPVFDDESRVLILGSLPSEASRAAGFYYMNPRNRFWKVMTALFGKDFTTMTTEEKKVALLRQGVALSDVIASCEIHRSDDASIRNAEYTDVESILAHSKVQKILLNGGKAYALFLKGFPHYAPLARPLPSTSPANARSSLEDLVEVWGKELE